jgi:hypothetical protein
MDSNKFENENWLRLPYELYSIKTSLCHIGGVMVKVLTSSAVECGFEPRSDQTKNYKFGICCFSARLTVLRRKNKYLLGSESD